jgi:hypothetical protein
LDNYYARVDEQSAIVRDFVGNKTFEPFQSVNFGTGTGAVDYADGEAWHSGNVKLFGGTASGAGIRCGTYNKAHILFGGERAYCYLKSYTLDATTMIFGIHDGTNATLPANGHYFHRSNSGVVSIRSANASTDTVHTGTYTISADTWYRYFVVVSTPRSHVTYVILDDTGNTVLFSKTVAAPFNNNPVGMNLITHSTGTDATVVRHILDKLYFNPRNWN